MMMFAAAAALAFAGAGAGAAQAATYLPASTTFQFRGTVNVQQNISLTGCTMNATVVSTALVGGANTASVTAASLSGGLCGLVTFNGFNWPIAVTGSSGGVATQLTISGIGVGALSGTCAGSSVVTWSQSPTPPKIGFSTPASDIPPSGTSTNPCKIVGTLNQISPATQATIAP
jgi:hypothetical protein